MQCVLNDVCTRGLACEEARLTVRWRARQGQCLSGGGVRAMIASLGALLAAEELGVLDCCSYTSALSGGAWLQGLVQHRPLVLFDMMHDLEKQHEACVQQGRGRGRCGVFGL